MVFVIYFCCYKEKDMINMEKRQIKESVEAVPGPAIIISKEQYEKMQQNYTARKRMSKMHKEFFKKIKDETKEIEQEELIIK